MSAFGKNLNILDSSLVIDANNKTSNRKSSRERNSAKGKAEDFKEKGHGINDEIRFRGKCLSCFPSFSLSRLLLFQIFSDGKRKGNRKQENKTWLHNHFDSGVLVIFCFAVGSCQQ
jgi:hypothetical protein